MKTVLLTKKGREKYILQILNQTHEGSRSPDSEIYADKRIVDGHYLIIREHSFGGGLGGWVDWEEFIGIAHGKSELSIKLYQCAVAKGKSLAKKIGAHFLDDSQRLPKYTKF